VLGWELGICGLWLFGDTIRDVALDFACEDDGVELDAARIAGVFKVAEVIKTAEEKVVVQLSRR
jgi:hypothetical protein